MLAIARLDIRVGDQVVIEKAGKIIPKVVRWISTDEDLPAWEFQKIDLNETG